MQSDFPEGPKQKINYIKAKAFQDQENVLTYIGWEKRANEDDPKEWDAPRSWKQKLKYVLRYSYPEWAVDETGEKLVNKKGENFRNRYYDALYPHGYTIIYYFEEGQHESGSKPLFDQFCLAKPQPGDRLSIKRLGEGKETTWHMKIVSRNQFSKHKKAAPAAGGGMEIPDDELQPDDEIPF